ncbi:MAG: anhydro-N-acetylmuramic acid kinase [Gemmatimonadota bacterium]|nr:MAG: anhydro-N-acetylmuramic acid kinase [Gemmatimonadota bacterium]
MSVLVVGLMSGTSLDGIDAALVEIGHASEARLVAFHTHPYSLERRTLIAESIAGGTTQELAMLHHELGEWSAEAARELLRLADVEPRQLACVASHGQTVWHEPGRATLQLGCAATIAERLGVRVVSDFRSRDVAAGGQGAPLVPMADAMLFGHPERGRALLNVGGMANVTWVPRRGALEGVYAFDTGPGVAVIDAVTRLTDPSARYDVDGRRAAAGAAVESLLERLLAAEYFMAAPPKSTGREAFGDAYAADLMHGVREERPGASHDDCVATALELTVRSVADAVGRWLPPGPGHDLLVAGGGARNPTLMARLGTLLGEWTVRPFEDEFFDGDAKEAVAFAYLGWRALEGLSGNVPAATGAQGPRVLGTVTC